MANNSYSDFFFSFWRYEILWIWKLIITKKNMKIFLMHQVSFVFIQQYLVSFIHTSLTWIPKMPFEINELSFHHLTPRNAFTLHFFVSQICNLWLFSSTFQWEKLKINLFESWRILFASVSDLGFVLFLTSYTIETVHAEETSSGYWIFVSFLIGLAIFLKWQLSISMLFLLRSSSFGVCFFLLLFSFLNVLINQNLMYVLWVYDESYWLNLQLFGFPFGLPSVLCKQGCALCIIS